LNFAEIMPNPAFTESTAIMGICAGRELFYPDAFEN
jgi:hypothetical protein